MELFEIPCYTSVHRNTWHLKRLLTWATAAVLLLICAPAAGQTVEAIEVISPLDLSQAKPPEEGLSLRLKPGVYSELVQHSRIVLTKFALLRFSVSLNQDQAQLVGSFQVCRLALECDHEYWSQFYNMTAALDYIDILFGVVGDVFERDVSTKLALTYIRIWNTVNDPYTYVGGDVTSLEEFQNHWRENHNPGDPAFVERDVAHLLSSRGVNGWANETTLCCYDHGFSISGGNALLTTLAQNLDHDVYTVAHAVGIFERCRKLRSVGYNCETT